LVPTIPGRAFQWFRSGTNMIQIVKFSLVSMSQFGLDNCSSNI
jgi:hypothetical protein